jgi:hypothetical protein
MLYAHCLIQLCFKSLRGRQEIYIYNVFYSYVITLTSIVYFLVWIGITICGHLLSTRTSFSIACKAIQLVTNTLNFCLFVNAFIMASIVKAKFAGLGFLVIWTHWVGFHCLLASIVSGENSVIKVVRFPYKWCVIFLFSCCFQYFFFSSALSIFTICGFLCVYLSWSSPNFLDIYISIFLAIFFQFFFCSFFLSFSSEIPVVHMLVHLIVFHVSLKLCGFAYFSHFSDCINSINLYLSLIFFSCQFKSTVESL